MLGMIPIHTNFSFLSHSLALYSNQAPYKIQFVGITFYISSPPSQLTMTRHTNMHKLHIFFKCSNYHVLVICLVQYLVKVKKLGLNSDVVPKLLSETCLISTVYVSQNFVFQMYYLVLFAIYSIFSASTCLLSGSFCSCMFASAMNVANLYQKAIKLLQMNLGLLGYLIVHKMQRAVSVIHGY